MKQTAEQIKSFIELHTSEMDNEDYIDLMREIAEWAKNQADLTEYREEELNNEE